MNKTLKYCEAVNGMLTACYEDTGKELFYLHSTFDPQKEAQDMISELIMGENILYIIYGFALGYHVRELLRVLPNNSFLCVIAEQSKEARENITKKIFRGEDWLEDDRLFFIESTSSSVVGTKIALIMLEKRIGKFLHVYHFPTIDTYPEIYISLAEIIDKETQEIIDMMLCFQSQSKKVMFENAWENFITVLKMPGISRLKGMFHGVPAIVVASGPSLDKNVHQLRDCLQNAVILSAGSALGVLKREDVSISPHFAVVVDPNEIMVDEVLPYIDERITLVVPDTIQHKLVAEHKGNMMFFNDDSESQPVGTVLGGWKEFIAGDNVLRVSLSVSTAAFFMALHLECNPIILVGQDLALGEDVSDEFLNKKSELSSSPQAAGHHAKGAGAIGWDSSTVFYEVEGVNCKTVVTPKIFAILIDVFNRIFESLRPLGYSVINATEGGALLRAAESITFKKAKRKYLQAKYNIREQINGVLKKNKAESVNWCEIRGRIDDILCCVRSEQQFWGNQSELLLAGKDNDCNLSAEEKAAVIESWDKNVCRLERSQLHIFIRPYLAVAAFKYWICIVTSLEYDLKKQRYMELVKDINEVLAIFPELLLKARESVEGECV